MSALPIEENDDLNQPLGGVEPDNVVELEIWQVVLGQGGYYEASTTGKVRFLGRTVTYSNGITATYKPRDMKGSPNNKGYLFVRLTCDEGTGIYSVHGVVAKTFLGDPPRPIGRKPDDYTVDHINGNKLDNRVSNLRYITNRENTSQSRRNAENNRLTPDVVREIRARHKNDGIPAKEIAKEYGVTHETINKIISRRTWAKLK